MQPGRSCPLDYRYPPSSFRRAPDFRCDALYVAGGLYGNPFALDEIERMQALEPDSRLVFNGDFHWFDADASLFADIQQRVGTQGLLGNVEQELVRHQDQPIPSDVGCGCAYPDDVPDAFVQRSNQIHAALSTAIAQQPLLTAPLRDLPQQAMVEVAGRPVALVHGDATSLAGWGFALEALDDPMMQTTYRDWFEQSGVDAFACSHTCLAVCRRLSSGVVINNGAAGMPNFAGSQYGVITRIAAEPGPHQPLYFTEWRGLRYEALAVRYDHATWWQLFTRIWPEGSAAYLSYADRIQQGTTLLLKQASPAGAFK
ncbi:metallophosphoesterase family protein [Nitrincola alkalilacustris]|uniref:metallophosphoesterase family protein n=1 Tax=Nitrincola alkalilacustris TaxID=1571224 RepID=UPI00124CA88A|nr:hypothetical protein [Nitrincola alkalilacustris]